MPLQLEAARRLPASQGVVLNYTVLHSTPGRDGTVLSHPLTLTVGGGGCSCSMEVVGCQGATPDEALDRMAVWLRRLAEGLEKRALSVPVPLA